MVFTSSSGREKFMLVKNMSKYHKNDSMLLHMHCLVILVKRFCIDDVAFSYFAKFGIVHFSQIRSSPQQKQHNCRQC